jgi:hypothetical protein
MIVTEIRGLGIVDESTTGMMGAIADKGMSRTIGVTKDETKMTQVVIETGHTTGDLKFEKMRGVKARSLMIIA